jgi:hypothetical protein
MPPARSIAAAQTIPIRGDVDANVERHLRLVHIAAAERAQVLVFPELSLTGYELDLAADLAFSPRDLRLTPLVEAAAASSVTLIVGAPVRMGSRWRCAPTRAVPPIPRRQPTGAPEPTSRVCSSSRPNWSGTPRTSGRTPYATPWPSRSRTMVDNPGGSRPEEAARSGPSGASRSRSSGRGTGVAFASENGASRRAKTVLFSDG